ncbi:hypothetical protein [Streptomyces sp. NPDC059371]|uniref:hypothetical protein n=1 Tax=Streptomyces sp. NPDC059371 TaxID=3346812 RepID=UPI003687E00A
MKTTMMFRNIANPQRTTLAHLEDADALRTPERPEHAVVLPLQTANPRRSPPRRIYAKSAALAALAWSVRLQPAQ